ncbi:hypothetical protein GGI06_000578 [Coemansia sp. S85]|nr:hypothetical protein GGI06_000578 [Coemansia sp. S85]
MASSDPLFLGLDLSTQQLKGIVIDASGRILLETNIVFDAQFPEYRTTNGRHINGSTATAPVLMWVEAIDLVLSRVHSARLAHRIRAISGAAQQHGSVYWSHEGIEAIGKLDAQRPLCEQLVGAFAILDSPVWEDSSTTEQCQRLEASAGGSAELARISGSAAFERFTGAQIMKIKVRDSDIWNRVARISLVSSFAASLLSGAVAPIDASDASGTNLYDIEAGQWSKLLCDAIDPGLLGMLGGGVTMADQMVGTLSPYFATKHSMAQCPVVSFTGDNPSAYAGFESMLRDTDQLASVISLGTSDTMLSPLTGYPYAFESLTTDTEHIDGHVLQHPTVPSRFIAMLCYKNGSLAREWVRDNCLGIGSLGSWSEFNEAAATGPLAPAAYGFYYLSKEILPKNAIGIHRFEKAASTGDVKCPSGAYFKRVQRFAATCCDPRAILESQIMSMRLDYSRKSTKPLTAAIVTGGASANPVIRQIVADVLGVPVLAAGLRGSEGLEVGNLAMPAYGAAVRALRHMKPGRILDGDYVLEQVCWPDGDMHGVYSDAFADFEFLRQHQRVIPQTIKKLYAERKAIALMTAYDYPTAVACERAGVDMVLVGDSLAMVALGHDDTSQITMDEMIHHSRAVSRGLRSPFIVTDLPFGSYQSDERTAVENAVRMVKEGRAEAVKLETGRRGAPKIDAIVNGAGIPVVGHIGLTPQTAVALGGFRVQGKSLASAQSLVDDALALQEAGCFAMVLEAMPSLVAETVTRLLRVPTIGIGAGPATSGQALVLSDMVGMFDRFTPKFCQSYSDLGPRMADAVGEYKKEVRNGAFPVEGVHTYAMPAAAEESWRAYVQQQFGLELGGNKSEEGVASTVQV